MARIFISYRREDAKYPADRIHLALRKHVAKRDIFIDIDNIPAGVDFIEHLDSQVGKCDILLALIGPGWLTATNPKTGARRLDDAKDFVRAEISSALKRGIQVAPILLDGAHVPSEDDLPEDLKALARRNGVEVRRETFDTDAERMIRKLQLARGAGAAPKTSLLLASLIILALLVIVGGGAWGWLARPFGRPAPSSITSVKMEPAAETPANIAVAPASISPATVSSASPSPAPSTLARPSSFPVLSAEVNDAILNLDVDRVADILKRGWVADASLDTENNAALHTLMLPCERNRTHDKAAVLKIAQMLVAAGAKPERQNKWGDTPLTIARSPKYCGPDHPVTLYLESLSTSKP